ncbi:hypothetical protein SAY86_030456 [Trapa natans]|uniref:Uncharacterized protein n=1 Tax=Trapa natans TaxID=22666 RepID=A0AAN7MMM6_TRANT|nr:hypothetical protein SAY86_030456 [Trapa natans]
MKYCVLVRRGIQISSTLMGGRFRSAVEPCLPVIEVLVVAEGVVPAGLGEVDLVGADELPDLGADLVEDVPPAAPALGPEQLGLLLVHLEVLGEGGLPGEDPCQGAVPPSLDGGASLAPDGREGLGSVQGPGGSEGRGQREGNGGEAAAEPGCGRRGVGAGEGKRRG